MKPTDVHLHIHGHTDECSKALAAMITALMTLLEGSAFIMSALESITKAVSENTSVIGSAMTLLKNIKAELDAAIHAGNNDPAIQALSDKLGSDDATLQAAIVANTPPTPVPAPAPAPTPTPTPPAPPAPPAPTPSPLEFITPVLTASANPVALGASVTLLATVTGTPMPTGTILFKDGATTLGVGTLNLAGVTQLDTSFTTPQSHILSAEYSGDAVYNRALSWAVDVVVTP